MRGGVGVIARDVDLRNEGWRFVVENDTGRVALDGDEVGALIDHLAESPEYFDWIQDAVSRNTNPEREK